MRENGQKTYQAKITKLFDRMDPKTRDAYNKHKTYTCINDIPVNIGAVGCCELPTADQYRRRQHMCWGIGEGCVIKCSFGISLWHALIV